MQVAEAVLFVPTLAGSTRQYMMKSMPSFLQLIALPSNFPPDFSASERLEITLASVPGF